MIKIESSRLKAIFHEPGDGFYRGTRFDRGGVADSILFYGEEIAAPWFDTYRPEMHDAVQGPAEEFSAVGFEEAAPGDTFMKIGVGLLRRPDDAPYDRFRLYEIADPGKWTLTSGKNRAVFRHELAHWYDYRKEIALTGESGLEISHALTVKDHPLEGDMYNHNFWTLGSLATCPGRRLDFPFRPTGHWRAEYDSVALTESGIRFSRALAKGESVFMGDLQADGAALTPYRLAVRQDRISVEIEGDRPVSHIVFWANHRIACLEPYIRISVAPGETFSWTIKYHITK